ncbi:MAG TPA: hypothetical protein PLS50_05460, partial [Candidatus Dojkabacteria bacterium]|nr:hypothetical protein [Candidatus Dojkabacteria bacterium]
FIERKKSGLIITNPTKCSIKTIPAGVIVFDNSDLKRASRAQRPPAIITNIGAIFTEFNLEKIFIIFICNIFQLFEVG